MVPTPYNVRWTSKLLRRDLKAIATKCTHKVRNMFSRTTTATVTPALMSNIAREDADSLANSTSPLDDVSRDLDRSSVIIHTINDDNSTTPPESPEVVCADVAAVTEVSGTFYCFLSASLKDLYASRQRDLPLQERWIFRGAWLLLHLATQYCSSNPSYDICKGRPSEPAGVTVPCEGLHYDFLPSVTTRPSRVSQMPTMVYAQRHEDHRRHDSLFSNVSRQSSLPTSPRYLWYAICSGALEHTKTVLAAESLLGHVGVKKDATTMLEVMGNPAKRLSEEDEMELHRRLGQILYPAYFADSH